jgi:large subunit ribosomal protein L25
MATLQARRRIGTGKGAGRRIRSKGLIPAVLYGQQSDPVKLAVEPAAVREILLSPAGRNSIFSVEVDGGETVAYARIADFQKDPVRRNLVHCDIERLDETAFKVWKVPVALTGESPAVQTGCKLTFITRYIKVRCKATSCPASIEVALDNVMPGDEIRIEELAVPEDVEFLYDDNIPILRTSATAIIWEEEEEEEEGAEGLEGEEGDGDAAEGDAAAGSKDD